MAQFEVFQLNDGLVVDLQTDLLGLESTRLVAPLRAAGGAQALGRLTPRVAWNEVSHQVDIPLMAAVRAAHLRGPVGSLIHARDEIKRAVDMLIDGV